MFAWAGALNRVKPAATAFVHRDASWLFVVGASWSQKDTPRRVASNLRWLDGLSHALERYSNGQAYQNFIDPALGIGSAPTTPRVSSVSSPPSASMTPRQSSTSRRASRLLEVRSLVSARVGAGARAIDEPPVRLRFGS
jgi:hypothetical protein